MGITLTDLQATTQDELDRVIHDSVYDQLVFLKWLMKNKKVKSEGGDFKWDILYDDYGLADAVDPNAKVTYETVETVEQASDAWKYYTSTALLTLEEQTKNYGKGQIIDLQKKKADEMINDFKQRLSTDIYTATPNGLGMTPISTIIDSAASYGGLDPATYSVWAGIEDNSTTTLEVEGASTSLMGMYIQAWFGENHPDVHFTTRNLLMKYASLVSNKTRYEYGGRDAKDAGMGRTNLFFMGDPIFADPKCPAGYWYGIDTNSIELKVHPDGNMKVNPWTKAEGQNMPWAFKREALMICNLKCKRRRTNFKFTALDYTE